MVSWFNFNFNWNFLKTILWVNLFLPIIPLGFVLRKWPQQGQFGPFQSMKIAQYEQRFCPELYLPKIFVFDLFTLNLEQISLQFIWILISVFFIWNLNNMLCNKLLLRKKLLNGLEKILILFYSVTNLCDIRSILNNYGYHCNRKSGME